MRTAKRNASPYRPDSRGVHPSNSALAAAVSLVLGTAPTTRAADAPQQRPQAVSGLEEIIVTATRREQTVQDVPYNISAVTGAQLDTAGVTDLTGITRLVPGLQSVDLGPRAASTNSTFIIRGLNTNNPSSQYIAPNLTVPLVSTYIDEVPLFTNLHFTDIERVEVLRGPQGTLYGSGSVGGTVRVIHNPPTTDRIEIEATTRGGHTQNANDPSYGIDSVINLPLGARVAWRMSASYNSQAGFINANRAVRYDAHQQPILADPTNPLTSGYTTQPLIDINSSSSWHVRNALLWKVTDAVAAELAYHHENDKANGFDAQTPGQPKYTSSQLIPHQPIDRTVDMASLTVTAAAGFATLTSSSSWYRNEYKDSFDQSGLFEAVVNTSPAYYGGFPRVQSFNFDVSTDRSFAQEFRLVSTGDGPWDWIAGLFYRDQKQFITDPETLPGFAAWSEVPGSSAIAAAAGGVPDTFGTMANYIEQYHGGIRPSLLTPIDFVFNFTRPATYREYATYGELTYKPTPSWQVTGGARVFWEHFSQDVVNVLPICGARCAQNGTDPLGTNIASAEKSFRDQIFKFNTSYKFAPEMTGYLTVAQGFRHGGANAECSTPMGSFVCYTNAAAAPLIPYKSDTAINYEIGLKGTGPSRTLDYSIALYDIEWKDIQVETFSPITGTTLIINGDKARSKGLEAEITARITDALSTTLGYSYSDAKLTSGFAVGGFVGRTGDSLANVSKNTASIAVDYVQSVSGLKAMRYHADAAYHSSYSTQLNNCGVSAGIVHCPAGPSPIGLLNSYGVVDGFTLLNASVSLELNNHLEFRLVGSNLTSELGITGQYLAYPAAFARDNIQFVTRPRTVGIEARYQFK
jgi:iron complex outermembrane receptor protein